MKNKCFVIAFLMLTGCSESRQNESEQTRRTYERFDSLNREMDSFNKKIEGDIDSAIHNIDSLLLELDSEKTKK